MNMTKKEVAKVTHDINNVWHTRFEGVEIGYIYTNSNRVNSPSYVYTFINHGFNDYEFIEKKPINGRR